MSDGGVPALEELELEFRRAIDSGDSDASTELGRQIDALEVPRPHPSLGGSALWYAKQGLKVFPLTPGLKVPMRGSHGCKDATDDPGQITAWWHRTPKANVGIATGQRVDVVDIDGVLGQQNRAQNWPDPFGRIEFDHVAKVLTPRDGGMHIYVPATGDGNRAGVFPGVDYRGVGGYVVAPPSVTPVGRYRFLGAPRFPVWP